MGVRFKEPYPRGRQFSHFSTPYPFPLFLQMKKFQRVFTVVPSIPEPLQPLQEIAQNLWFSWNKNAIKLFQRLDPVLWRETHHNPVLLLRSISQKRVDEMAKDEGFLAQIERVYVEFEQYVKTESSYEFHLEKPLDFQIAYFSAEYGLTDCLPIYSGGLGVLAGDFLKSASDLRLPVVAIGLLYKGGFFSQYIDESGWQTETYPEAEVDNLPISPVSDANGKQRNIELHLAGRSIIARIWMIQVGRIPLYLLDTDTPENSQEFKDITRHLYSGDRELRLRQEILLGKGGVRLLEELEIKPSVFHMNEGHAAFAALERIRGLIKSEGLSFKQAKDAVITQSVFTTHTPVPAGNDRFDRSLMEKYFHHYVQEIGISFDEFMALGRENPKDHKETFCMTVLALKLSCKANGVSELHSEVSRDMWKKVWPDLPLREIPITHITNGVHVPSWISIELSALYDRYLGLQWSEDPDQTKIWENVDNIPESELWRTHSRCREALVAFVRRKVRLQLLQKEAHKSEVKQADTLLDPKALTIGFARRFATYKRGDLLFSDPERLAKILNNEKFPVQIVFAGKAHPLDNQGKEIIRRIISFTKEKRFQGKIIFLEDYNMNIARFMVQGVDIWLNNPLPPLEACGTSGMKAAMNGAMNLSILDGWWCEGYKGDNGWSIGRGEKFEDRAYQDEVESRNIYNILEQEAVPLFYERGFDNIPRKWVSMMKNCLRTVCPNFNSHRMAQDYTRLFYLPSEEKWKVISRDSMSGVKDLSGWLGNVESKWNAIQINKISYEAEKSAIVGDNLGVQVEVFLKDLQADDVSIDLYHGRVDSKANFLDREFIHLTCGGSSENGNFVFSGEVPCLGTGKHGFTVRILPKHDNLISPYQTGLIVWG